MPDMLPKYLPDWYKASEKTINKKTEIKTWTPETGDIDREDISNAWNGSIKNFKTQSTIVLGNLHILTPLQVGGGSLPEGGNIPAQIGGVPCIPGSSLRGSFLNWIVKLCNEYEQAIVILALIKYHLKLLTATPFAFDQVSKILNKLEKRTRQEVSITSVEYQFWQKYLYREKGKKIGWKPKTIRFETTWLENLKLFPFNSQQDWQIFDDPNSRKLGVMWQVDGVHWGVEKDPPKHSLAINLHDKITPKEEEWFKIRLTEMLIDRGVGKGSASGFGRLGNDVPKGKWNLQLKGMKPGIQPRERSKKRNIDINGRYRWSPQVLRACLRGYFTRLALTILSKQNAEKLTEIIFGGLKTPARLFLTSYLVDGPQGDNDPDYYVNIPKNITEQTWSINVNCNQNYDNLVDNLLFLASKLGGLGAGWRRPPHCRSKSIKNKNGKQIEVYRGSSFTVSYNHENTQASQLTIPQSIENLINLIKQYAINYEIKINPPKKPVKGSLVTIWQGINDRWDCIVHKICSTNDANRPKCIIKRPDWCGDSKNRTSGYAIQEYKQGYLLTIFDPAVSKEIITDETREFYAKVWSSF